MINEKEVIEFCVKAMKMLFDSRLTIENEDVDICTLNEVLENISDDDTYSCIEAGYKRGYLDLLEDLDNLLDCNFLQENFDEYMKNKSI